VQNAKCKTKENRKQEIEKRKTGTKNTCQQQAVKMGISNRGCKMGISNRGCKMGISNRGCKMGISNRGCIGLILVI
jgi:hypothetical protein